MDQDDDDQPIEVSGSRLRVVDDFGGGKHGVLLDVDEGAHEWTLTPDQAEELGQRLLRASGWAKPLDNIAPRLRR